MQHPVMIENYNLVLDEMRAHGLVVQAIETGILPGKGHNVRRCKVEGRRDKPGWYRLSVYTIGGKDYLVGAYGIYQGLDPGKVSVSPGKDVEITREQREAIRARQAADAAKAKALAKVTAERASQEATRVWRRYLPTGTHGYLTRKGVGAHGVRFHPTAETLAIPMLDATGKVWGLELIRGADRGERLEKQYWPRGTDPVGHFHLIGGSPRDLLLIAEGYATAASVYEATGLPCAVAFSAGNLLPVARALKRQYPRARILLCADDDYRTPGNPGVTSASAAAIAVDGRYLAPVFATERPQTGAKGATDFNDLQQAEGLQQVRTQLETFLAGIGWLASEATARPPSAEGAGATPMPARLSVDEAVARFWGTYGMGGKALFDRVERRIVHKDDVCNLLPQHGWQALRDHPDWRVVRDHEVGFDPTEADPAIKANLWGGWPTEPREGTCTRLLELLEYLCSGESNGDDLYNWVLDWLAYPIQRPGAKMHTALVFHGPQGTGKNLFFEAYMKIFGRYARVLGQEALEDKFNSDWAEAKLFILADEVLARQEMFQVKNRLKGFITGDTIRVNPKNVAAHNERNQMNIVFLSNERQPLVLEPDDRRHCVVWVPPALPESYFDEVVAEISAGGVAALHHYLLNRDLSAFHVAKKPPLTGAKGDLVTQGTSSEARFVQEWRALEIDTPNGVPLPFCPCLGTHLYAAYRRWCERHGERARRSQDLIGHCSKIHGWTAGRAEWTWTHFQDKTAKRRKMVVPSMAAIEQSLAAEDTVPLSDTSRRTLSQMRYRPDQYATRAEWLTVGYMDFFNALGIEGEP